MTVCPCNILQLVHKSVLFNCGDAGASAVPARVLCDVHSGPTPRGRGASDAAFAVSVSSGKSKETVEKLRRPILRVCNVGLESCSTSVLLL